MHFISFEAPVHPDDRIAGRQPPPGRELASSIVRGLERAGFSIVEPLAQHESYGWSFAIGASAAHVSCILQLSDEWLLITHVPVSFLDRLRRRGGDSAEHGRLDAALLTALSSLPDVLNVRWFGSEGDFREGRSGQP
jgi:hypothetical protein